MCLLLSIPLQLNNYSVSRALTVFFYDQVAIFLNASRIYTRCQKAKNSPGAGSRLKRLVYSRWRIDFQVPVM